MEERQYSPNCRPVNDPYYNETIAEAKAAATRFVENTRWNPDWEERLGLLVDYQQFQADRMRKIIDQLWNHEGARDERYRRLCETDACMAKISIVLEEILKLTNPK